MEVKFNQHRRMFAKRLALLTGGSAILSSTGNLQLMQSAFASSFDYSGLTDYKSLVCIFLEGGNDSLNTLIPYTRAEYKKYANVRQTMAIPRDQLLPISDNKLGFHPSLPGLRDLYNEGKIAIANNIGNLFEPISRDAYFDFVDGHNPNLNIPPDLFAHNHQQEIWQTNLAPSSGTIHPGWGGTLTDLLISANNDTAIPSSFTFSGSNLWQAGENTNSFGINARGIIDDFSDFNGSSWPSVEPSRSDAWNEILNLPYNDLLQDQVATSFNNTQSRANVLREAIEQVPELQTPFSESNGLALRLRSVAKMIAIREVLGLKRQTFYVSAGGFDNHSDQLGRHAGLLSTVNDAMLSFQRTLEEMGVEQSVTTFTASEFGRSLTSNGNGTDHAWATDYMVMGGAVEGGKTYGEAIQYSDVSQDQHRSEKLFGAQDVGSGRFIPQHSTDQYGATLAKWMGIEDSDLDILFPNLRNFSSRDLGFIRA